MDARDAVGYIEQLAGENANIIFGAKEDPTMTDEIQVTVIATGLAAETPKGAAGFPGMRYATRTPQAGINRTLPPTSPVVPNVRPQTPPSAAPAAPAAPVHEAPAQTMGLKPTQPPVSNIKEKDIVVPDFLKKTRE